MKEPLAHSAKPPAGEQSYREHVGNVLSNALKIGCEATTFAPNWRDRFMSALEAAAAYHDMGKLDPLFQDDLAANRGRTRTNHVDAGTAHLLRHKHAEAAVAVYAHHRGLPSFPEEKAKNANGIAGMFRDLKSTVGDSETPLNDRTDALLEDYIKQHCAHGPRVELSPPKSGFTGLIRRLLLSCLVDADHSDTARHYGNLPQTTPPPLEEKRRLAALDSYVSALHENARPTTSRETQRNNLREAIYQNCRHRELVPGENMLACDSPVGTGKTTAIMAHLLRVAMERKLRRIFIVLPYTNIIDQSVNVYREALALPGESVADMEAVVSAVHHRVEFSSLEHRHLAATWEAPIVVTTAVQFFETLAACRTSSLRKLHQLPGSAVFVDEAHASMPPALWPQMFRWLDELCNDWSCHAVLASGTLARFWELEEFNAGHLTPSLPDLISPELRNQAGMFEDRRIHIRRHTPPVSLDTLSTMIQDQPGPRLVILNTVQSAAILAHHLREQLSLGDSVEHLSTALTPNDRAKAIRRIRARLKTGEKNWCLIATSCVEAGVDFSFRTAFRESCGLMNLLQTAGRVSRSGEHDDPDIWDFRHDGADGLTLHPQFKLSRQILGDIFQQAREEGRQPIPDDVTEAWRLELRNDRGVEASRIEEIQAAESAANYPEISSLCRLIDADTQTVIVEPRLIEQLESPNPADWPPWRKIMMGSVQLWANKLNELPVAPIKNNADMRRVIEGAYNPFLGWMAGMVPLIHSNENGLLSY